MSLQVACVVRAFQHLHQRHIIYRDMQLGRSFKAMRHTWRVECTWLRTARKPENLLLDSQGYCKALGTSMIFNAILINSLFSLV